MGLSDFLQTYLEGMGAQAWGPDWRQKLDQLRANTARINAATGNENAMAPLEMQGKEAQIAHTQAATQTEGLQQQQLQETLAQAKAEHAEIARLVQAGKLPSSSLKAADYLLNEALKNSQTKENAASINLKNAEADFYRRKPAGGVGGEFSGAQWVETPTGPKLRTKSGQLVDAINGQSIAPMPTADQRNAEKYDAIIPVHLDQIQQALDSVKQKGTGVGSYLNPEGYMVREQYSRLVNALAATAGRAMGDSRISDMDRAVYARLYGVANQLVGIGPGTEMAQRLLDQARQLSTATSQAREQTVMPGQKPAPAPANNDPLGIR